MEMNMDKNFKHDTFVVVNGRIGTPVNNPGLDEKWKVWFGGNEFVEVDELDEWFGEYDDPEQNLKNAQGYCEAQAVVAQATVCLFEAYKKLEVSRTP